MSSIMEIPVREGGSWGAGTLDWGCVFVVVCGSGSEV